MTDYACLVCHHPRSHHVDPTDHLFAVPSVEVNGCRIIAESDAIELIVNWQLHESPAAQSEQRRRESAARWNWREA